MLNIVFKKPFVNLFGLLFISSSLYAQNPNDVILGFDGLADLNTNVDDFGVSFTGATVLACGESLNCGQFPPFSGRNVVYDDPSSGGLITATFDPLFTGNVRNVSARVTGNRNVTMTAFNKDGNILGMDNTGGANYVGSGTGISANKLLTITVPSTGDVIAQVNFHDSGNTYTIDDFTFTAGKTVMLDAGHGQILTGGVLQYQRTATPTYGLYEDNLTLDMAQRAKNTLESDGYVVLDIITNWYNTII